MPPTKPDSTSPSRVTGGSDGDCPGNNHITMYQVTYHNTLLGQRRVLINNIDEAKADQVVAKFSDDAPDPWNRLPEVRKEPMAAPAPNV